ncbi:MAG TPA: hypothetical protein VM285_08675, partial [Polyangia bacterium]|nr:hypothetical protein [Polyangia bacterium]
AYPAVWNGAWSNFGNTFTPSNNSCGDGGGGDDVWFVIHVPAGHSVTATETTTSNVTLRLVAECGATTCLAFAQNPETMTFTNATTTDRLVYLVVSRATGDVTNNFSLSFTMI